MNSLGVASSLAQNVPFNVAVICFFVLVAFIDLRWRRVPNVLVFPAAVAILLTSLMASPERLPNTLLGGAFGFILFALTALLRPNTLGGGDVKLAALIGLAFGFPGAIWALMVGILAGGFAAVLLLLTRRGERSTQMPYAPFLCLGVLVALFYNPFLPFTFGLLGLK